MLHMAVTVILGNPNKHVGSCSEFLAHMPAQSKKNTDTTKSGCLLTAASEAWKPQSLHGKTLSFRVPSSAGCVINALLRPPATEGVGCQEHTPVPFLRVALSPWAASPSVAWEVINPQPTPQGY